MRNLLRKNLKKKVMGWSECRSGQPDMRGAGLGTIIIQDIKVNGELSNLPLSNSSGFTRKCLEVQIGSLGVLCTKTQ